MKKHISRVLLCVLLLGLVLPGAQAAAKTTYVALTFDDGPSSKQTDRLLDILKKYDAKATFFVLGERITSSTKDIMKRMGKEGHAIGNHSYSHPNLTKLSASERKKEITDTQKLIEKYYSGPKMLRPPYGSLNDDIRAWCKDNGYTIMLWSVDPEDWKYKNAKTVSKSVIKDSKGGDFILLHDIHKTTVDAAEILLKSMTKSGYKFVTIPTLISKYDKKLSDQRTWRNAR